MSLSVYINWNTWFISKERRLNAVVKADNHFTRFVNKINVSSSIYEDALKDVTGITAHNCPLMAEIPNNLMTFCPHLTGLDFFNCSIRSIARDDLSNYKALREISFRGTKIRELPRDLFFDLTNLELIHLDKNDIRYVGGSIFKHLKKLRYVSMTKNPTIDLLYAPSFMEEKDICPDNKSLDEDTVRVFDMETFNLILERTFNNTGVAVSDTQNSQDGKVIFRKVVYEMEVKGDSGAGFANSLRALQQ